MTLLKWLIGIVGFVVAFLMIIGLMAMSAMETEYHNQCMNAVKIEGDAAMNVCSCATDRFMDGMENNGNGSQIGSWYGGQLTFEDVVKNYYGYGQVAKDVASCTALEASAFKR